MGRRSYGLATRLDRWPIISLAETRARCTPALIRLEQKAGSRGAGSGPKSHRDAKYYSITKPVF